MARWENWNPPTLINKTATLEWTAGHASIVHEGAEGPGNSYPARPWTDVALTELDFEKEFTDNLNDFDLDRAFYLVVAEFIRLCKEAMTSEIWYWYNATQRKNGQLVLPGKRDIYDMGELFNSLIVSYGG